jgi:hypothetical protein
MSLTFLTRTFSIVTVLGTLITMIGVLTASTAPLLLLSTVTMGKILVNVSVLTNSLVSGSRNAALQRTETGLIRWKAPPKIWRVSPWCLTHDYSNRSRFPKSTSVISAYLWMSCVHLYDWLPCAFFLLIMSLLEPYPAMNKSSGFNQQGCFRKRKLQQITLSAS